jgi:hypothetical protein
VVFAVIRAAGGELSFRGHQQASTIFSYGF